MADFLFEIGLEEVPARMIAGAEAELLRRTVALLGREGLLEAGVTLESEGVRSYSTPRRLAVLVRGVREQQADVTEEVTGPAVKIAYKDGQPTPAAEAFARKNGIAVTELKTILTPKGEYLAATSVKKGRAATEVIASELPKEIAAIYWAKNMYWRPGKPEKFVRPVLWMVCLLGDAVVPVSFAGKTAERASFGHRVLSSGEAFEVVSPDSYLAQLEGEFVLADVEARRHKIRKALDKVTRTVADARWREDEALVDSVTHLTEWPDVLLGGFSPEFLALPEEVLVTVMRDHQKYFAVEDANGKLAPHFLAVLNISLTPENDTIIRQGNERVLRARFNDARFFWEFDQRTPLADRIKLLENVTFQKDLGSYAAKSERVRALAAKLAGVVQGRGATVDAAALDEAARLAKTDLTTELVKEFTELQGMIGGLYARSQGASAAVANAIYDQYTPASSDDTIPRSAEGSLLGLADRIDTLSGMFALGMEPTGSKDPFALRRAANAVVRILAEGGLPLSLSDVLGAAGSAETIAVRLRTFFEERVAFYLREVRGHAYDVVKAVMVSGANDLRDAVARAEAVSAVRGSEDFLAVSAAFKRMKNILQQAEDKSIDYSAGVRNELLTEPSEAALAKRSAAVVARVEELRAKADYRVALEEIAALRPQVDGFFDAVMVMAPDEDVRANRLALLARMVADFSRIADFSEIVVAG
ncbi:MAG TPA: glycine--tRNA ligase subunit beta [Acidobacteriaceae bacterium]|jgi:glycyl-tRNA synthetase beta chain